MDNSGSRELLNNFSPVNEDWTVTHLLVSETKLWEIFYFSTEKTG